MAALVTVMVADALELFEKSDETYSEIARKAARARWEKSD